VIAEKLQLPLAEFEKALEQESANQTGNPVFSVFFPAMVNVRRAIARVEVRRAMLLTALDVQLEGEVALKNHADPVMGGLFESVPFEGGYELRSKLKARDDKPLTLTVGAQR
jgi:hypothetical protein